MLLSETLRYK